MFKLEESQMSSFVLNIYKLFLPFSSLIDGETICDF